MQRDLIFVGREREEIISEKGCEGAPNLVVEVTSFASSALDRQQKRELYARYGVKEYWLVDPVSRPIDQMALRDERLTLKGTYSRKDERITSEIIPELSVQVSQVFDPA